MARNWDTETKRFAFTEARVEKLPRPKTRVCYYDQGTKGFGIKLEPNGNRVYFWFRAVPEEGQTSGSGKPTWITIGSPEAINLKDARGEAEGYNSTLVAWQKDPTGEHPFRKPAVPEANGDLTLGELQELYITKYLRGASRNPVEAEKKDRWRIQKYAQPWLKRSLHHITREDVLRLHQQVKTQIASGTDTGTSTANRLVEQLRRMFFWAGKAGLWQKANPAANIIRKKTEKQFAEKSRDRFVQPEEMLRLESALAECANTDIRDFVILALQTGARRSNVCAMRYEQINWATGLWLIPETKNGQAQIVPLSDKALAVLRNRAQSKLEPDNPWVFPSRSAAGHLMDPKSGFKKIREAARLTNVTVHDLRRTKASYAAIAGVPLQHIGKMLGHGEANTESTLVYARLQDALAVREAQSAGERKMRELMKKSVRALPSPRRA
jgi:integrase